MGSIGCLVLLSPAHPFLLFSSTEDCEHRVITVTFNTWAGGTVNAAFFDLGVSCFSSSFFER